jgi:hypothetical protein
VGDPLTVKVLLSHLDAGEQLDALGVDVSWDSTLLSNPTTPASGPIVPDPTGFSSGASAGHASGQYDDLFATGAGGTIGSTGLFFSFTVAAAVPGSGTITFSPPPTAFDAGGGENDPATGPALSYDIAPTTTAVPEPASFVLVTLSGLILGGHQCLARRRDTRHRQRLIPSEQFLRRVLLSPVAGRRSRRR